MRNFLQKIAMFMQDRYGNDNLNFALLILTLLFYVINLFVRNIILLLIALIPFGVYIYRALSKNINKRLYENRKFLEFWNKTKRFCRLQYRKIKEIKTHRYFKCPYCKAQLRTRRRPGTHPVKCPICQKEFTKTTLF